MMLVCGMVSQLDASFRDGCESKITLDNLTDQGQPCRLWFSITHRLLGGERSHCEQPRRIFVDLQLNPYEQGVIASAVSQQRACCCLKYIQFSSSNSEDFKNIDVCPCALVSLSSVESCVQKKWRVVSETDQTVILFDN